MRTAAFLIVTLFCVVVGAQEVPRPLPPGTVPSSPMRQIPRYSLNADPGQVLPENYVLTLVASEKEKVVNELAIVVASAEFTSNVPDTTFSGTLTQEENGSFLLRYTLGAGSGGGDKSSFRPGLFANSTASVRLRLGEPVSILKVDGRIFKVTIARLSEKRARD